MHVIKFHYRHFLSSLLLGALFTGCSSSNSNSVKTTTKDTVSVITKDFVFGDDRPFLQCHASTLTHTRDGKFVIAWFGGTHEKHDDVGIWLSKGKPGAWSAPVEIAKLREDAHWNPVLFTTPDGDIILYFKVGKTIDEWETWFKVSADNGATWSEAKELVPGDHGGRGPVRNKPITLFDGTWLAPASNERAGVWNAFVDRSNDEGKTWTSTSFLEVNRDSVPGEGVIQPTLWESSPGQVHMLLRSSAGVICRSDSKDSGLTWSPVYKTSLPNPNSGIDLTKFSDGTLLLVYNRDGRNWGARRPISFTISHDNGKTWSGITDLDTGNEGDEFSYPAVISFGDTAAGTYTWKRQRIAFWMGTKK
jgi:predicted neuraminidase